MKESTEITTVELDIVNRETGEVGVVTGVTTTTSKFYNIREITTRVHQMNFTQAITTIATTAKQGIVLAELLDMVDADNRLVILNQAKLARKLSVSRELLKGVVRRLGESELARKVDIGLYYINPFIFIGKRTRSNAAREALQMDWMSEY